MLVVGRNHELARQNSIRVAELSGVPIVFFTQVYSTRALIERCFETANATLNLVCETNSIDVMLGVVLQTNVATILPEGAIEKHHDIHVLQIIEPVPLRVTALLWSRHNYRTFAARAFAEITREHFLSTLPLKLITKLAADEM